MPQREAWWDITSFLMRSVLTLIAATILVLEANGFVIDFNRFRIEKAGLLVLMAHTDGVKATVDGKPLVLKRGQLTKQYFPDQYELDVRKDGYQSWRHQVHIEKGHVARFVAITLFLEHPTIIGTHPATSAEQQSPLVSPQLRLIGSELWFRTTAGEQLITRLSTPMIAAVMLDPSHVLYETHQGVHVIDIDGSNDQLLVESNIVDPLPLLVADGGKMLSIIGEQVTTKYQLQ